MDLVEAQLRSLAEQPDDLRKFIMDFQNAVVASGETTDLAYFPVKHVFAPGSYAREMTIPEGQVIFGKIHRHAHVNIISAGRAVVLTEQGVVELRAPCTFVSEPGVKRVVYAPETVVWTTVHVTDKTDLAEIEAEVIAPTYDAIELSAEFRREQ